MRRTIFASTALTLLLMPSAGGANPVTQDPCPGIVTDPVVWKQLGGDVLENLLFDSDSLWVSDGTARAVRRFGPSGAEGTGLTGVDSPGGLATGPDGLIYAGIGNSLANSLTRSGLGKVVRFSPSNPNGSVETYSSGFNMPNGLTFGPGGEIFISNDLDYGLIRITPATAPAPWAELSHVWGTNGLVVDPAGVNLYAAVTFDQRSPIVRVPLDGSGAHAIAAQLSVGAASLEPAVYTDGDPSKPLLVKGLDDMTRDAAGTLYVVGNGSGELLRVDPATGGSCLIASGFQNPSSVRIAPPAFALAGPALTFFVTEFSGAIQVVGYTP
ncbi:MAG: hypothetical protein HY775_04070 [Acidobacteria bacterium]|nr:hypothetical protein [Acidobacteriota bacterium]